MSAELVGACPVHRGSGASDVDMELSLNVRRFLRKPIWPPTSTSEGFQNTAHATVELAMRRYKRARRHQPPKVVTIPINGRMWCWCGESGSSGGEANQQ